MNSLCVDSCLAVKWVFREELEAEAGLLLEQRPGATLIQPASFLVECASVAFHKVKARMVTLPVAVSALRSLEALPLQLIDSWDIATRTVEFAHSLRITAWDAVYLAVAEAHDCEFWTVDATLYRRARRFPFVNLLLPGFPSAPGPA